MKVRYEKKAEGGKGLGREGGSVREAGRKSRIARRAGRESRMARARRRLAVLLAVLLLFAAAPQMMPTGGSAVYGTTESAALQKRAELVIFIRFKGEKEFVSGTTAKPVVTLLDGSQIDLNEWYNAQNAADYGSDPSLNQFVQKVTYRGTLVKPIYASANGQRMASYECSTKAKDADFDDTDWFEGVQVQALKAVEPYLPKDTKLDYDGDGEIDNCMFLWGPTKDNVIEYYLSSGDGSRAWHWVLGKNGTTIRGLKADCYVRNFIYSKASFWATGQAFSKAAMIHEFMHTLGVPDLYSEDEWYSWLIGSSTLPVGDWDIQSDHREYGSTFLAQRIQYLKAGTFGEITESGTYTLYDVNDPNPKNGINGYKIPTRRANEYFVIEYRRGVTDGAAAEHGDGILVYRVKSDEYGNTEGDEEIHLYGRVAGFNSTASIADSAQGVGDPLNGGLSTRNDLEFTDGSNSGICVRNVGPAGTTITFDVILP